VIWEAARNALDPIVARLQEIFPDTPIPLLWIPPQWEHVMIRVIQEAQELMDPEYQATFRSLAPTEIEDIHHQVREIARTSERPQLRLLGFAITLDGGLIATFSAHNGQ